MRLLLDSIHRRWKILEEQVKCFIIPRWYIYHLSKTVLTYDIQKLLLRLSFLYPLGYLHVGIFKIIISRISFYCNNLDLLPPKPKFTFRKLKKGVQELHLKFVLVPLSLCLVLKDASTLVGH